MKGMTMTEQIPNSEQKDQPSVADSAWLQAVVDFKESLPENLKWMEKYI